MGLLKAAGAGCSQRWTDNLSLYSRGGFERLTPARNRSTHRKQLFTFPARAAHSALATGARWRPLLWAVLIRSIFTLPSYRKVKAELNPRHFWLQHGCAHFIWKQRNKNGFSSETTFITFVMSSPYLPLSLSLSTALRLNKRHCSGRNPLNSCNARANKLLFKVSDNIICTQH